MCFIILLVKSSHHFSVPEISQLSCFYIFLASLFLYVCIHIIHTIKGIQKEGKEQQILRKRNRWTMREDVLFCSTLQTPKLSLSDPFPVAMEPSWVSDNAEAGGHLPSGLICSCSSALAFISAARCACRGADSPQGHRSL